MSYSQRASFSEFVVVLGILATAGAGSHLVAGQEAGKKEASKTGLGDKITIPANLSFAINISQDKQAATIIFSNCQVDLAPPVKGPGSLTGQTASKTKVATIHFPFETDLRSVKLTIDVRGFRSVGSGAHARLILCAGESTKTINTSSTGSVVMKGKAKDAYKDAKFAKPDGDFVDRVEVTVQKHAAKPVCQVTLFLEVDQDTDVEGAGGALLVVDSLDISISKGKKTSK